MTTNILPYLRGDGRSYIVSNNWGASYELFQTQRDGGAWFQVKNGNYEMYGVEDGSVYFYLDTSPGSRGEWGCAEAYYTLVHPETGRTGQLLYPAEISFGTVYESAGVVEFKCLNDGRPIYKPYFATLYYRFRGIETVHFDSGKVLSSVLVVEDFDYLNDPRTNTNAQPFERKYYALDHGLVGWEEPRTGKKSFFAGNSPDKPRRRADVPEALPIIPVSHETDEDADMDTQFPLLVNPGLVWTMWDRDRTQYIDSGAKTYVIEQPGDWSIFPEQPDGKEAKYSATDVGHVLHIDSGGMKINGSYLPFQFAFQQKVYPIPGQRYRLAVTFIPDLRIIQPGSWGDTFQFQWAIEQGDRLTYTQWHGIDGTLKQAMTSEQFVTFHSDEMVTISWRVRAIWGNHDGELRVTRFEGLAVPGDSGWVFGDAPENIVDTVPLPTFEPPADETLRDMQAMSLSTQGTNIRLEPFADTANNLAGRKLPPEWVTVRVSDPVTGGRYKNPASESVASWVYVVWGDVQGWAAKEWLQFRQIPASGDDPVTITLDIPRSAAQTFLRAIQDGLA